MMHPELRPYQREAVVQIYRQLSFRRSTLRCACTGSGKTHEQAAFVRVWLRLRRTPILWVCPRDEILRQSLGKLIAWNPGLTVGPDIAIEKAGKRAHPGARVVLASIQSLRDSRLEELLSGWDPGLVIVDEAHVHYDRQLEIFERMPEASRVGWTATPDRADMRHLLPRLYESVAAVYELGDAVREGSLVRLDARRFVVDGVTLDGVPSGEKDFNVEELSRQLLASPEWTAAVVRAVGVTQRYRRKAILFACTIEHGYALAAAVEAAYPALRVEMIHGEMSTPERQRILARFGKGQLDLIVTVELLTYGVDLPAADALILARPTKSRALYSQMIGRGMRLHPGKVNCLVMDVVGNTDTHTLVTPESALKPALELKAALPGGSPSEGLLKRLQEALSGPEEEQKKGAEAFERSLPSEVRFHLEQARDQLAVVGAEVPARQADEASLRRQQLDRLTDVFGMDREIAEALGEDQAEAVLGVLERRRRQGRATLRQALALQRAGLNPDVSKGLAKTAITHLAENGWRPARWLLLKFPDLVYTERAAMRVQERTN
ncbi:MAG: DEAD/DEAH box helicase family protein [Acidobacteria bacterium]|nr:DEAD/DEAH box helicase family protein [Acidobacteriota bacterium]